MVYADVLVTGHYSQGTQGHVVGRALPLDVQVGSSRKQQVFAAFSQQRCEARGVHRAATTVGTWLATALDTLLQRSSGLAAVHLVLNYFLISIIFFFFFW